MQFDNCASDGYVGNIHTLAISSVTMDGKAPEYAERCAAVIATAYSGSLDNSIKIVSAITVNHVKIINTYWYGFLFIVYTYGYVGGTM